MEHKSTREKMANMTRKEKASYIWEYYRFHIIGTIAVILILTSFISGILKQKDPVLGVTILGSSLDTTKMDELKDKSTNELIKDNPKNKKIISYEFMTLTDNDLDQYSRASREKLMVTVAANELDIVIIDKANYEGYVKQGMFLQLDSIPQFSSLNLKNYGTIKGKVETEGGTSTEGIYGISVENLPVLKDLKYDTKNKVLCIISNTKRLDTAIEYIQWLLNQTSI